MYPFGRAVAQMWRANVDATLDLTVSVIATMLVGANFCFAAIGMVYCLGDDISKLKILLSSSCVIHESSCVFFCQCFGSTPLCSNESVSFALAVNFGV